MNKLNRGKNIWPPFFSISVISFNFIHKVIQTYKAVLWVGCVCSQNEHVSVCVCVCLQVTMAKVKQVGLLAAGCQPWNKDVCAASGDRFAYCATLAIYIYQVNSRWVDAGVSMFVCATTCFAIFSCWIIMKSFDRYSGKEMMWNFYTFKFTHCLHLKVSNQDIVYFPDVSHFFYGSTQPWFPLPVWLSWTSSTMSSSWDPSCPNTRRPSRPSAGALTTQTCSPQPRQTTCSSYGTWPSKKLWPDWTTPKVDGRSNQGLFLVSVLGSDVSLCLLCLHRGSHLGQLVFELVRRGGLCVPAWAALHLGVRRPWAWSDGA